MKLNSIIISLILILITSCSGKQIVSGNLPDIERLTLLELGKDNKESVKNLLGTPSFEGTLGDNSYYYVGTLSSKFAFLKKKTQKQYIIELTFNKKDGLSDIEVSMSDTETSTYGIKKSFLRGLIDNFGVGTGGLRRGGPIIGSGKADD